MGSLSRRQYTDQLSLPKPLPAGFHEDRRSVYWENGLPSKDYSKVTVPVMTPRLQELVSFKCLQRQTVGDRTSPIWPISKATLQANCSQRLAHLARPKSVHVDYRPCRKVMTTIRRATLSAHASSRVSELAKHKMYSALPIKPDSEWDWGEWKSDIKSSTLKVEASDRVCALSRPKSTHPLYKSNRPVQWVISPATLTHTATERLQKLAEFKQVAGYREDYNGHAWSVSRAALLAQPSPRLEELATPLPRKCRTRKT